MKQQTEQQIVANLKRLKDTLGHEPNVFEVDACKYLPTARTLQRRFGGVEHIRKLAGFTYDNHTKGIKRSKKALESLLNSNNYEKKIINQFFTKYHDTNGKEKTVVRHYAYQQYLPDKGHYINISCDVAVTDNKLKHVYMFDFFYPSSPHSLYGCVRSKLKKLRSHPPTIYDATYSIIFVCTNPKMTAEDMNTVHTELGEAQLMDYKTFKETWL